MNLYKASEVINHFQKGDLTALETIYQMYKDPLYRFIYRYTNHEQLSIDIVQDTFEKLQKNRHRYDANKGALKTYLYQIAFNTMRTKLKRRSRFNRLLPFLVEQTSEKICSPEDRITIQTAILALPEELRAVIILAYYHDLTQREIAKIVDIPIGTVKSRLFRALQKLKKELGGQMDG